MNDLRAEIETALDLNRATRRETVDDLVECFDKLFVREYLRNDLRRACAEFQEWLKTPEAWA